MTAIENVKHIKAILPKKQAKSEKQQFLKTSFAMLLVVTITTTLYSEKW